jgi:hypothetical protein
MADAWRLRVGRALQKRNAAQSECFADIFASHNLLSGLTRAQQARIADLERKLSGALAASSASCVSSPDSAPGARLLEAKIRELQDELMAKVCRGEICGCAGC